MLALQKPVPDQIAAVQARLLASAFRLETFAEDRDLPGFSRRAYRDLAAKCRADADSLEAHP
jgi:hypothetical protein